MPQSTIIALLTDFGTCDTYVAEVKAVILSINPHVSLIDISHAVPPGDIAVGSYMLWRSYKFFPDTTTFLAVVDPGVGSDRRILAVDTKRYRFVAPDNGLLSRVVEETDHLAFDISGHSLAVNPGSATFQARDVMAPAAAYIGLSVPMSALGTQVEDAVKIRLSESMKKGSQIAGQIISIDRYGNAITNIAADDLDLFKKPIEAGVLVGDSTVPVQETYSSVAAGEPVAYIGSCGLLELGVNGGSMADRFGLSVGTSVTVNLK